MICSSCGYQNPAGRVYHRGSRTVVAPSDATLRPLLKWCPPTCTHCNDPLNPITPSLVATVGVKLADVQADSFALDWSNAFLVVEYGSGDADLQRVEIDLMNGCSFPLIGGGGQYVNFYIVHPTLPTGQELQPIAPILDVSISVGLHGFGGTGPRSARRTVKVGFLEGDQTTDALPIPRYAVGVVFTSTDTATAVDMVQLAAPFNGAFPLGQYVLSKFEYSSVPVVHGARAFTIHNPNQDGVDGIAAIFYLAPA